MINDNRKKTKKKYEKARVKADQTKEQRDIALRRRNKSVNVFNKIGDKCDENYKEHNRAEKAYKQASVLWENIKDKMERDHEERRKADVIFKILQKEYDAADIAVSLALNALEYAEARCTIAIDRYNEDKEACDGTAE